MKEVDIKNKLKDLYLLWSGNDSVDDIEILPLPQAGGDRLYYRLKGKGSTCIGTFDSDINESRCFLNLARDFRSSGCAVPEILTSGDDCRFYLQEDLGDISLFSKLKGEDVESLVKLTLERLVKLQQIDISSWRGYVMSPEFCIRQVMWDLNYFKYEFLKPSGAMFDEELLENDFENLANRLISIPRAYWGFMMRDCQSRNVMISDGPVFIDFQGGRFGPCLYDAVSLLWQARAGFSPEFRDRMLQHYVGLFCGSDSDAAEMLSFKNIIVLFRTLQVLGAYGFRGLVQHRSHFILSIPGAIDNVRDLIKDGALDEYPELKRVCRSLVEDDRYKKQSETGKLRIEIFSFSYKKGYPQDMSGNGGGFMFDCRAMHNPGRYKEYRTLTGLDSPVIKFLEERGEVQAFLYGAWSLTDPAIERYLSRGFTNLQIGFGCTGGQHRSVYCAEATARHVREFFPEANVCLIHREQLTLNL